MFRHSYDAGQTLLARQLRSGVQRTGSEGGQVGLAFLPAEHPSSFQGLKNVAVKLYKEIERDLVQGPFLCGTSGGFLMHQGRGCDSILQEKLLD